MPTSRSMRALVLERHSGPFILTEAELPTITVSQVLVRIKASGVNPLDTKIRTGNAAHARVSSRRFSEWIWLAWSRLSGRI